MCWLECIMCMCVLVVCDVGLLIAVCDHSNCRLISYDRPPHGSTRHTCCEQTRTSISLDFPVHNYRNRNDKVALYTWLLPVTSGGHTTHTNITHSHTHAHIRTVGPTRRYSMHKNVVCVCIQVVRREIKNYMR